ncbi:hypothetical protein [Chitinophaga filiformis]|uniref:Uncharacterized protein n=1 Tax=Chitinophaga filiformis TaxID=104663 RepID=A0ABY4HXH6_CHIFI|nr:hypothetical protein [Chitinophaga filiformis]UPK68305.1 hypothetical protein MYF79_25440 [Chitinophaga filiformis]
MKIIKKVKHYLYYFGLKKNWTDENNQGFNYTKVDDDTTKEHLRYLKELIQTENERQNSIESKTSQLVGQCGLIFSLLGLFVPVYFDKFIDFSLAIKIVLLLPFLSSFLFYILAIIKAIENYNITKYRYISGSVQTVINRKTKDDFINSEINDLLLAIKINTQLNNKKGTNLLHAFRSFRFANVCIAILGLFIGSLMLFYRKPPDDNKLINRKIEKMESRLNLLDTNIIIVRKQILNINNQQQDTSKKMKRD